MQTIIPTIVGRTSPSRTSPLTSAEQPSVATAPPTDIYAADQDPTQDGRPLPPPNPPVVAHMPTPLGDKVVSAACVGAAAWTLTNIGMQIAGLPAASAVLAAVGTAAVATTTWAATDAASGAFHFLVDNYGGPDTPVVGTMVREFQEHHVHPWDLEEVSVWSNCAHAGRVLGPALLAVAAADPHYLVQAAALSVATAGYFAQASHRWAHMAERAPAPVKVLQDLGVLQGTKSHDAHHAQPVGAYCIVNGMANPLFDKLNVWRKAEYYIHKATGVEPNTWLDPEIKNKALGVGNPADFVDPAKRQEGRRAFWQGMLSKIETWRRGDKPKEA